MKTMTSIHPPSHLKSFPSQELGLGLNRRHSDNGSWTLQAKTSYLYFLTLEFHHNIYILNGRLDNFIEEHKHNK